MDDLHSRLLLSQLDSQLALLVHRPTTRCFFAYSRNFTVTLFRCSKQRGILLGDATVDFVIVFVLWHLLFFVRFRGFCSTRKRTLTSSSDQSSDESVMIQLIKIYIWTPCEASTPSTPSARYTRTVFCHLPTACPQRSISVDPLECPPCPGSAVSLAQSCHQLPLRVQWSFPWVSWQRFA